MTNDLITNDDADIAALNNAAENISTGEFVGIPLKFKKGEWLKVLDKKEPSKLSKKNPSLSTPKAMPVAGSNGRVASRPINSFIAR